MKSFERKILDAAAEKLEPKFLIEQLMQASAGLTYSIIEYSRHLNNDVLNQMIQRGVQFEIQLQLIQILMNQPVEWERHRNLSPKIISFSKVNALSRTQAILIEQLGNLVTHTAAYLLAPCTMNKSPLVKAGAKAEESLNFIQAAYDEFNLWKRLRIKELLRLDQSLIYSKEPA